MQIKILVAKHHTDTLIASKQVRYGKDQSKGIRNSYELGKIIQEGAYTPESLKKTANAKERDNVKEFKSTTYNLSADVIKILDELKGKTGLSRAEIIRAIIDLRQEVLDKKNTSQTLYCTSSSALTPETSAKEVLNKITYNHINNIVTGEENSIVKILRKWAADDYNVELENPAFNPVVKPFYKQLGWNAFEHFYVLNTFYIPILSYAAICSSQERPLFRHSPEINAFEMDIAAKREAPKYIHNIAKKYFAKTYIDVLDGVVHNYGNRSRDKEDFYTELLSNKPLNNLAEIIYTLPNFTPIPDGNFNQVKGILASDSLPVFVNLIQQGIDTPETLEPLNKKLESAGLALNPEFLMKWRQWLIEHRENSMLEDFYVVINDRLLGIPLFPEQSISKPVPCNEYELTCYFERIQTIYKSRTLRMIEHICKDN